MPKIKYAQARVCINNNNNHNLYYLSSLNDVKHCGWSKRERKRMKRKTKRNKMKMK